MPGLVLLLAVGWSGFWFYAASHVDETFDAWRTREARSGRVYECANRSVAGFPFRLEVSCDNPSVTLTSQTASQIQLTARLKDILVLAQVYDPTKIIAEFTGPVSVNNKGEAPSFVGNWTTGRASASGLPSTPQRVSIVFDDPAFDRISGAVQTPLLRAKHLELHTRLLEGSLSDKPVVESALEVTAGSLQGLHPVLAAPFDADIRAILRGLNDFAPKPWPERFREIQAAGGRLDFTQSRVQQGDTIAVAAGSLGITPSGYLNGELTMTVVGLEKVVAQLGLDKLLAGDVPQSTVDRVAPGVSAQDVNKVIGALDRMIPGLGNLARKNVNAGVTAGINMLGQETRLEGKPARSFPLRFTDGVVSLGPLRVAQTPPLF
ncbi:MAG: hypothetical protein BGN84_05735 [Afipia sp. 62-7]|nr:DUF2125 domain-containing protein [Afipia sp.]OJU15073.1 MAG: hypothetical protein BGN84_05735 [Afipia sp. 62-7]